MTKKKNGRPKLASGHNQIRNARRLFDTSVANGTPDFRYVALAIGEVPIKPPKWAIDACIEEKELTETASASVAREDIGIVLDEAIRIFYDHEEETNRDGSELPFAAAIREACKRTNKFLGFDGSLGASELKTIRDAWKREQKESNLESNLFLEGFKPTERIDRVLIAKLGSEFGMSTNPMRDIWDHENLPCEDEPE